MNVAGPELLQLILLISTVAASYGVVRSNVTRMLRDLTVQRSELDELVRLADELKSRETVIENKVAVLAGILSPDRLSATHREMARLGAQVEHLLQIHTGQHPET